MSKTETTTVTQKLREALRYDFDPADWETFLYLQKALHPYEHKFENYVTGIFNDIVDGLSLRDYFRMPYQQKVSASLMTLVEEEFAPTANIEIATFVKSDFLDAKGDLDLGKVRKAARLFCVRQMEMLR